MSNFAVVGVGTWGQMHAKVYASTPGAHLAAICDANEARAREIAEPLGVQKIYTDYNQLFTDPEIDAVSIVLPDFMHRDAVIAAANAGKHVLVEKPLATTEADGQAMIAAAENAGVSLFVDFHNRWSPLFQQVKTALDEGELGDLQMIYYRLSDTIFVPTQMLKWSAQSSVAWFLASHNLDTLLWLLNSRNGGDTVEKLYCVTRSRVLRERGIDTPDFFQTTLEWKSGLVTQMENCWILPESGPSIVDLKCELVGSKGAMYIDSSHHRAVEKQTDKARYLDAFVGTEVFGTPTGFGTASIRHFAESIIAGEKPRVDGIDGLAVTRLILKMQESAEKGQPVGVGDLYR